MTINLILDGGWSSEIIVIDYALIEYSINQHVLFITESHLLKRKQNLTIDYIEAVRYIESRSHFRSDRKIEHVILHISVYLSLLDISNNNYGTCHFFYCTLNIKTNSVDRRSFSCSTE